MRRLVLVGRSECGKTTLKQVLKGEKISYHKTQYVSQYDILIDMPGEYAENLDLAHAIDLYVAEADVVGVVLSATEPYSLYPPNVTPQGNREAIGIVTKIDHWAADPDQAERWLRLCGCKKVFRVSAYTGEGIQELIDYMDTDHVTLPVGHVMDQLHQESFQHLSSLEDYHMM